MDGWKRCPNRGRERPEGPLRDRVKRRLQRRRFDPSCRMMGAGIDPGADRLNSLVGKLPVGRHGEGLVGIPDRAGEDTFSRRPRHDHRPCLPARRKPSERIEPQAPLLLLRAVTRHAVRSEKRGNLFGKKGCGIGRRNGRRHLRGSGRDRRPPRQEQRHHPGREGAPSAHGWEAGKRQRTGPRSVRPRSLPTQTPGQDTPRIPSGTPPRGARTPAGRPGKTDERKKNCRPLAGAAAIESSSAQRPESTSSQTGCGNGRPVDPPSAAQPPGTVAMRH